MPVYLCLCLSICMSISLLFCTFFSLSVFLTVELSCLFVYVFVYLSVHLSYLSFYMSDCHFYLSVSYIFICLCEFLSFWMSVCCLYKITCMVLCNVYLSVCMYGRFFLCFFVCIHNSLILSCNINIFYIDIWREHMLETICND